MEHPYQVINPGGDCVLTSSVRYSKQTELDMLDHGYTIKLNGRKLTKTEVRKELGRK